MKIAVSIVEQAFFYLINLKNWAYTYTECTVQTIVLIASGSELKVVILHHSLKIHTRETTHKVQCQLCKNTSVTSNHIDVSFESDW